MLSKIRRSFPTSRKNWILFTATSLPIIFSAMIYSINGVIDNFMAIPIDNGIDKLSYANTWTSLVTGIIAATTVIGSSLFGQYYGAKDRVNIRYVLRLRILIALGISSFFAFPAFFAPEFMVNLVGSFQVEDEKIIAESALYLRIIALTWLMGAWGYTSAMIMREAGHGRATVISSVISLSMNMILNSIFVFGFKAGIWSLAVSTIISQVFSLTFNIAFVYFKDKEIIVNPLKLFVISKQMWMQIIRRSYSFLFLIIGSLSVSIRFIFWNANYSQGTIGSNPDYFISAATILGISGAVFNIFWSTFESIGANTTIFVGRELGHGNFEKAKANANELQGFHFIMAILMGSMLLTLSFIIPYMTFLADGYESGTIKRLILEGKTQEEAELIASQGVVEYLNQLKMTIWPLAGYMPMWIWFITRSRVIIAGGKTNIVSLIDTFGGIVQTIWISILVFIIIPNTDLPFPTAYAIFFLSDVAKLIVFETLFHKLHWWKNLTLETKSSEVIQQEV
ncbi:MAG: MATE family efflux transporter [Metamycoplasmataceae bacterium]